MPTWEQGLTALAAGIGVEEANDVQAPSAFRLFLLLHLITAPLRLVPFGDVIHFGVFAALRVAVIGPYWLLRRLERAGRFGRVGHGLLL